jgi:hypothetical protein
MTYTESEWPRICASVHHMLYGVDITHSDDNMQGNEHTDWYYKHSSPGLNSIWLSVPDYLNDSNAIRELAADCLRLKDWTVGVHVAGSGFCGWCWVRKQLKRKAHTYEAVADTRAKAQVLVIYYALGGK